MTAHDLARRLLNGPDNPVHFAYNYGDHGRTLVAAKVTKVDTDDAVVRYSAYHQMDKVVDTDDDDENERYRDQHKQVVLLW